MKNKHIEQSHKYGFKWEILPANEPWRQGIVKSQIRIIKKLLKVSVGDLKLTPLELQTSLYEIANLCNKRPMGVFKNIQGDRAYKILTPNMLLMGRAINSPILPGRDIQPEGKKSAVNRFQLVQEVSSQF